MILWQWRIRDFPEGACAISQKCYIFQFFASNRLKMKEFGPQGPPGAPLGSANVCVNSYRLPYSVLGFKCH